MATPGVAILCTADSLGMSCCDNPEEPCHTASEPAEAPTPSAGPMGECGGRGQECCDGDISCNTPDLECNSSPFFPETECVLCGLEDTLCCFGEDGEFSCNSEELVCDFSLQDVGPMCMKGTCSSGSEYLLSARKITLDLFVLHISVELNNSSSLYHKG